MLIEKIKPENYIKYFRTDGLIGCLHSEFLLKGPLGKGMLVINKDLVFYSYVDKKYEKDWAQQGLDLYGNEKKFNKYVQDFKIYIKQAKIIIKKYKKPIDNLTKEQFLEIVEFVEILWKYYGFLETQFQEFAYNTSIKNGDKKMKNNLDYSAKFKFEARDIMIAYYFQGGIIQNIYNYFSRKYKVDGAYLFMKELLGLFDGKKPKSNYKDRKKCYAVINSDGKNSELSYQNALKLYKRFEEKLSVGCIKGTVANKGKVTGRAIIVPMFDNHAQISIIDKRMKKGDILIAESTSPEVIVLCRKAAAIVTNQGGMLSHAVIVSRELKIPCVVNTRDATLVFKDGDLVEVDANKGIVKIIERAQHC